MKTSEYKEVPKITWHFLIYWKIRDKCSFLKMFIRSRLKLWWGHLYLRKNEFHSSLDMDYEALSTMNEKQRKDYIYDLVKRRQIAHENDLTLGNRDKHGFCDVFKGGKKTNVKMLVFTEKEVEKLCE